MLPYDSGKGLSVGVNTGAPVQSVVETMETWMEF